MILIRGQMQSRVRPSQVACPNIKPPTPLRVAEDAAGVRTLILRDPRDQFIDVCWVDCPWGYESRLQSDLALTQVVADPAHPLPGQSTTLQATVVNQGAIATPLGTSVTVRFSVDGTPIGDATLPRFLASGESATVSITWSAVAGGRTIVASVDPDGAINQGGTGDDLATISIAPAIVGGGSAGAGGVGGGSGGGGGKGCGLGSSLSLLALGLCFAVRSKWSRPNRSA